uniref:arginine kinase n=1 Tax=Romanomermis culicivorax TaxID=13658 RepID=A0A915IKC7_ROMCU
MTKIEEGYVALQSSTDCKSLLKKYLTKDVLDKLKAKKTSFGSTLWDNYKEMEQKMITLFGGIKDPDLQGTYYPLTGMTKEVQNELIKDHFLFKEGDRFLREANACRFWPTGRGIFLNQKKTFLVWVNEEDHLRIISMQPGGHVGQVLQRLIKVTNEDFFNRDPNSAIVKFFT